MDRLFTSESVAIGHPDKIADTISDSILDAYLKEDPQSKVAVETLVTTNTVIVAGEVKSKATIEVEPIVRNTIKEIGYTRKDEWFNDEAQIYNFIHWQSPDITMGVEREKKEDQGAGDQWIMFGYATNETESMMPLTLDLAHKLLLKLRECKADFIRPDAKSQVTVEYQNGKPVAIDTILISTMHTEEVSNVELEAYLRENIISKVIEENNLEELAKDTKILINPTGRFVIGWPNGDTGLTGRKVIVDTYGGRGAHGWGAFSGKDPSKVDRSWAYYSRYIAKNLVKAGVCDKCLIQVSYAIGVAEPVSIYLNTYGTVKIEATDKEIVEKIKENFSFKPRYIEETLQLRKPIYKATASYWHFGRNQFPREQTNLVEKIQKLFNL